MQHSVQRTKRLKLTTLTFAALMVALAIGVSACGGGSTSPSESGSSAATGKPATGGALRIGIQPLSTMDPYLANNTNNYKIMTQIYQKLTTMSPEWEVVPELATEWEPSADAMSWTFTIRSDAKFSNGDTVTADDVVFSFDRIMDPDFGAVNAPTFANVKDVAAQDATHVVFTMKEPNPEFPKDTAELHSGILSAKAAQQDELIGSGPFMLESYAPNSQAVLARNPHYYAKDADGVQLPYLDSVVYVISPSPDGAINGLLGGQVDMVQDISVPAAGRVQANPAYQAVSTPTNFLYSVHVRSDKGHPGEDPRIAKALRMGTDYQALADLIRPGMATVGNGTSVGPLYGDYYWDNRPVYDPEGAKKLLAEAGQSDLSFTLHVGTYADMPEFAVAWQAQMKQIGVNIDIVNLPEDVFYGDGQKSWLVVDYGFVSWVMRVTPLQLWQVAYMTGAVWNESHWSDAEFDATCNQIAVETDDAKRAELYQKAQQILWERGPYVYLAMPSGVTGISKKVANYVSNPDSTRESMAEVWLQQ